MLRMSDATRESLRDGQVITAFVRPAGEDHAAPATLNWSFETGATVRLVEPTDEWALEFNSVGHVMHLSVNEGEEYTMLDARVSGATADGRISKLNAYTLALGTHTDNDELLAGSEVFDSERVGVVWRERDQRLLSGRR